MIPLRSPTLWVHVTTLMTWTRPPVGIVRVEQEYVRWLLQQPPGESVRFCLYDPGLTGFREVAADAVRARLERASEGLPLSAAPPLPLWKRAIKAALLACTAWLPAAWAEDVRMQARRLQHTLLQLRDRDPRAPLAPVSKLDSGPLQAGDRFVSLGLDWDNLDMVAFHALKQRLGLKVTLIAYDVIPLLRPHLVVVKPGRFGAYFVNMAWCADTLLCISEHTRRDCEALLARIGAPVPPMHVIRLGADLHTSAQPTPADLPQGLGERPFVLFVSTIERRKNHEILYRAWTRLREQGVVPHRLVFVGMQGWGVADFLNDLALDPRSQDDIVCLNHVPDEQLAWLYRNAAFTVFPSLYEGWGLPVVESLAFGKFCLASNSSSLPEAGGPWAESLDPWDLPAWVERLKFLMQNPQEVQARNARIAREFTPPLWSDTAAAIHRIALRDGGPS